MIQFLERLWLISNICYSNLHCFRKKREIMRLFWYYVCSFSCILSTGYMFLFSFIFSQRKHDLIPTEISMSLVTQDFSSQYMTMPMNLIESQRNLMSYTSATCLPRFLFQRLPTKMINRGLCVFYRASVWKHLKIDFGILHDFLNP